MELHEILKLEKGLKGPEGQPIKVSPLGSMGLLALGDIGILLWRAKRQEAINMKKKTHKSTLK